MFRPKRGKNRFEGEADAQDEVNTLSAAMKESTYSSPDGRKLRRRWALGIATCLLIAGVIIGVTVRGRGGGGGSSGSGTDGGGESSAEYSTNGSGSTSLDPDKVPYQLPKSPTSAYQMVESDIIEELQSSVAIFKHTKSGMPVLTVIPKDSNQDATFGINFRTPPEQEDGAQFVVENAILAGSVNYPIKDPFNQVKRGSLQTYWDTWTNRDRTSFVVASRNLADFRNNLKVMIDAVFHPLFLKSEHKWIYRQEAWRLETPDNKHLTINGCVRVLLLSLYFLHLKSSHVCNVQECFHCCQSGSDGSAGHHDQSNIQKPLCRPCLQQGSERRCVRDCHIDLSGGYRLL
jgi:hypothetical protein